MVYIHNGILLSHNKEWNNAICGNMNGPGDYHTKRSKSDRGRQLSYHIAYMRNLKEIIQINLFTKHVSLSWMKGDTKIVLRLLKIHLDTQKTKDNSTYIQKKC